MRKVILVVHGDPSFKSIYEINCESILEKLKEKFAVDEVI